MNSSQEAPPADTSQPSLANRTATGVVWQFTSGVVVRVIGFVSTLLLTRFLAPAEYGEVLVAAAVVITAVRFTTLGLSQYIIVHHSPAQEVFQAMVAQLSLSATALVLVTAMREPLAQALNTPGMARYVPPLALATFVTQSVQIPAATLVRSLCFRVPATARALGELTYATVSVGLAPSLGATAVVAGNLARGFVAAALIVWRVPLSSWWSPRLPNRSGLKGFLSFGLPLTGASIAETVSSFGDNLLVARFHGPAPMALYNLSYNVATTPTAYIADQAADVLLPGLSALKDPDRRRLAFLRALGLVFLMVAPLIFGLAAVSPTMVAALLDSRWSASGPIISVLSVVGAGYMLSSVTTPYLLSHRRAKTQLILAWMRAISLVILMTSVGRLGVMWAAASASAAVALSSLAVLVAVSRGERIPLAAMARQAGPALGATVVMVTGVLAMRSAGSLFGLSAGFGLVLEIVAGTLCYTGAAVVLGRDQVRDLAGIVGDLHRRWRA